MGHKGLVNSLSMINDYLISSSTDKTIRIWDLNNFIGVKYLLEHSESV